MKKSTVLDVLVATRPRERAGAVALNRYEYQANLSILKVLDLHGSDDDYRVLFDYFDDFVVLNSATDPTEAVFLQIKTRDAGRSWTMKGLRQEEAGTRPASILGKMYSNAETFGQAATRATFVTNAAFRFKLPSGAKTTAADVSIRLNHLHDDEVESVNAALEADFPSPRVHDPRDLFFFECASLPLRDQAVFVRGRLVDFLHQRGNADGVPIGALYQTLYGVAVTKSACYENFSSLDAIYNAKSLTRSDIEALLNRASAQHKSFLADWPMIARELDAQGLGSIEQLRLRNAGLSYYIGRTGSNLQMVRFAELIGRIRDAEAQKIAQCTSFRQIVDVFDAALGHDERLPSDLNSAAMLVEAYETANEHT